jgi:hypothetical protein
VLIAKGTPVQVISTLTNHGAEGGAPVHAVVTGLWYGSTDTDDCEVRANLIAFPAGAQPVPLLNFRIYDTRTAGGSADTDFNGYAFLTDDTLSAPAAVMASIIKGGNA